MHSTISKKTRNMKKDQHVMSSYRWDMCAVAVLITLLTNCETSVGKLWMKYSSSESLDLEKCIDVTEMDSLDYVGSKTMKLAMSGLNADIVNSEIMKQLDSSFCTELAQLIPVASSTRK